MGALCAVILHSRSQMVDNGCYLGRRPQLKLIIADDRKENGRYPVEVILLL